MICESTLNYLKFLNGKLNFVDFLSLHLLPICGVPLTGRKRAMELMLILGFNLTIYQLTMANSVWLCVEKG